MYTNAWPEIGITVLLIIMTCLAVRLIRQYTGNK